MAFPLVGGVLRLAWLFVFFASPLWAQKTWTVKPGDSIHETLKKSSHGDTVEVMPGTYHETVVIDKSSITLLGKIIDGKWPTLDGKGKLTDGVISSGSGFRMEGFQVKNYKGNGVTTQGGDNVILRKLMVKDTGIYGIYPTRGSHVLIEDTVTSGIADAGIYVGMCEHVEVRRNEVYENVAGIEIENSSHVIVEENYVHNNAGGILVFTLPGLPVKDGEDTIVRRNLVQENNHKNFAADGAIVGSVPSGSGIVVLAGKRVRIENNIIRGNRTGGILFTDLSFVSDGTATDPAVNPQFDDNQVLSNLFFDNGKDPAGRVKLLLALKHFRLTSGDIVAYGAGSRNCIASDSGGERIGVESFTACPNGASTASVKTAFTREIASRSYATPKAKAEVGERIYSTVCAGCHGMGVRLIGPPVEEIQKKYHGDPTGIASFARSPKKVREGYPAMPAQGHLGPDQLTAVAEYLLKLKH